MTTPYICTQCCHRAAHRVVLSLRQQRALASSYAVGNILDDTTGPNSVSNTLARSRRDAQDTKPTGPTVSTSKRRQPLYRSDDIPAYLPTPDRGQAGRYSAPRQNAPMPALDKAERAGSSAPDRNTTVRNVTSELTTLVAQDNLQEAWILFLQHYSSKDSPALARPSFHDFSKVQKGSVFNDLVLKSIRAWLKPLQDGSKPPAIPCPKQILDHFEEIGLLEKLSSRYLIAIAAVLGTVVSEKENVLHMDAFAMEVLRQLMDIWARCFKRSAGPASDQPLDKGQAPMNSSPWSFVSGDVIKDLMTKKEAPKNMSTCFQLFLPKAGVKSSSEHDLLLGSALLTYDILTHGATQGLGLPTEAEQYLPFVDSMKHILLATNLEDEQASGIRWRMADAGMDPSKADEVLQRLGHMRGDAARRSISKRDLGDPETVKRVVGRFITSLGRASEKQSLDGMEKLWAEARQILVLDKAKGTGVAEYRRLYEHFMLAFLNLRRPQSAMELWNHMIGNGFEPEVGTWSVMMKGCHLSRDFKTMEGMWQRMRRSGIRPDAQAWSTRIFGLFRANRFQDGFRALEEMGQEYTMTVRQHQTAGAPKGKTKGDSAPSADSNAGAAKPNTVVLNSAISGLASQGSQYISRVLQWGKQFGIERDIISFNAFLNVALAKGAAGEATGILKEMAANNVQPDSATFTILLNSLFRSDILSELSPQEQEDRVMSFIASVENDGIRIDDKGYALIIDRLLKEHSNLTATHRVFAHMAAQHIEPTPHIYTILMTHYFALDPPDLRAADALWSQIQARNAGYGAVLDIIFFDRMVEGYARHGDVGRMMAFLTRMSKEGKRPGWLALTAVVRCLAERGEWDRVGEVVNDVRRGEGLLSTGVRGIKGQLEFRQLVTGLGYHDPVLDRR